MTALFEFSASFVDAVAPDVRAAVNQARAAFAEEIDSALPRNLNTYWEGDDYVIDLTAEQTAEEFGSPEQPPRPVIRQAIMSKSYEAKKIAEEVIARA